MRIARLCVLVVVGLSLAGLAAEGVELGDSAVRLRLSPTGAIVALEDRGKGVCVVRSMTPEGPAWRMGFASGRKLASDGYPPAQVTAGADSVVYLWQDEGQPTVRGRVRFVATEKAFRFSASISRPEGDVVETFEYPAALALTPSEGDYMAACGNEPRETASMVKPLAAIGKLHLMYPGIMKMQFVGIKAGASSLLCYTDDVSSLIKWHRFDKVKGNRLSYRIEHMPRLGRDGPAWDEPYGVVLRVISGGGYNEWAQAYGEWARKQEWAKVKYSDKCRQRPLLQCYTRDGCVRFHSPSQSRYKQEPDGQWVYTGDRAAPPVYQQVLGRMTAFEEKIGIHPGYWYPVWSGHRFDTPFPDYFPVEDFMGDIDAFRQALVENRRPILLHMNMAHWPARNPSFRTELAATWHGKHWKQRWSNLEHYVMSPDLTRRRELENVDRLRDEAGVNGIYIDVLGATYLTDDNPRGQFALHPNPFQAARNLTIQEVRRHITGPIMTESRQEGFLGALDIGFGYVGQADQDPLPLWQMVYGDCVLLMPYIDKYGSPSHVNQTCLLGGILEMPRDIEKDPDGIRQLAWRQRVLDGVLGERMLRHDRRDHVRVSQWSAGVVVWRRPEAKGLLDTFTMDTSMGTVRIEKLAPNGILVWTRKGLVIQGIGAARLNETTSFVTNRPAVALIHHADQTMLHNPGAKPETVTFRLAPVFPDEQALTVERGKAVLAVKK